MTQRELCVLVIESDMTSTLFTKNAPQSLSHRVWSLTAMQPTRSNMKLQTSVLSIWPARDVSECPLSGAGPQTVRLFQVRSQEGWGTGRICCVLAKFLTLKFHASRKCLLFLCREFVVVCYSDKNVNI